jgi:hypothetical protein
MRTTTLTEVREVLSSAPAMEFFEAWARAEADESASREQWSELTAQALVAEARAAAAEQLRGQGSAIALPAPHDPFEASLRLRESALLNQAALDAALQSSAEAGERRQRAAALRTQADAARARLEAAMSAKAGLRETVDRFGASAGSACLFFADSETPGAAFVVPLRPLPSPGGGLPAFMLHRLGVDAPLENAVVVRDSPPEAPKENGTRGRKRPRRPQENS